MQFLTEESLKMNEAIGLKFSDDGMRSYMFDYL